MRAKRLLYIIQFIAILVLMDLVIGYALRKYYFSQTSGIYFATTYAMEKTNEDMLVLGSSKANHHYKTSTFDSLLHLSFYNAGRDGQYIFYHYAVLKAALNRYNPKIVILDIKCDELEAGPDAYERLTALLPYDKNHPEIRPVFRLKGKLENVRLCSNIYPFNSLLLSIAMGNLEMNKTRRNDIKGYVPLYGNYRHARRYNNDNLSTPSLDSNKINYYSAIIEACKLKGIKLCVVVSPYYFESKETESTRIAKVIATKYTIPFWDYSTFLSGKPDYFVDNNHLNDEGATLFSAEISKRIKETGLLGNSGTLATSENTKASTKPD